MYKDKDEINGVSTEREECERQLKEIGFNRNPLLVIHDDEKQEESQLDHLHNNSNSRCLNFLDSIVNNEEDFLKEENYKLTNNENILFSDLPEWHRNLFINFPGKWTITKEIFQDDKELKQKNYVVNQWLIKCSIKAILKNDEMAVDFWQESKDWREIHLMNDELPLTALSVVVFPLIAYSDIAEDFEDRAAIAFQKESISISELEQKIKNSLELTDIGVLVHEVWKRYLDDKQDYIATYRKSVMNSVFNNKKAESGDVSPSPQPTTTELLTHTPDGLPIPWLMKEAERKPQLPAQMTDAAYRLFRKLNQRNHDSLEDLFNLLTPEYLPDFVAKRNTQTNAYLVELTLTDGRKHNYDNFRKNASKKFI